MGAETPGPGDNDRTTASSYEELTPAQKEVHDKATLQFGKLYNNDENYPYQKIKKELHATDIPDELKTLDTTEEQDAEFRRLMDDIAVRAQAEVDRGSARLTPEDIALSAKREKQFKINGYRELAQTLRENPWGSASENEKRINKLDEQASELEKSFEE